MLKKKKKKQKGRIKNFAKKLWERCFQTMVSTYQILTFPLLSPKSYRQLAEQLDVIRPITSFRNKAATAPAVHKDNPFWRLGKALIMRAMALPVLFVIFISVIVYASVRPEHIPINSFPESLRLFYEHAEFKSEDGTTLRGWFIPSLSAEEIVKDGDEALRRQKPAVVLCHGLGANRDQFLPLASLLNHNGFEVLLFDFRACGLSEGPQRSFGLHERDDVIAAVHYLASRSTVDRQRIAIIGQDVGGVAALGAAARDHSIRAVVVADVDSDLETALSRRLEKIGCLRDLSVSAYMYAYKSYFSAHENQVSSVHMAAALSDKQSLLLLNGRSEESFRFSAQNILKKTRAQTEFAVVSSPSTATLSNVTKSGPVVLNFLKKTIGPDK
jgi:pimeloyl-ACP methyl ester carboxylesterase